MCVQAALKMLIWSTVDEEVTSESNDALEQSPKKLSQQRYNLSLVFNIVIQLFQAY